MIACKQARSKHQEDSYKKCFHSENFELLKLNRSQLENSRRVKDVRGKCWRIRAQIGLKFQIVRANFFWFRGDALVNKKIKQVIRSIDQVRLPIFLRLVQLLLEMTLSATHTSLYVLFDTQIGSNIVLVQVETSMNCSFVNWYRHDQYAQKNA